MTSRTSCFNKSLFRKNLTRFAPVGLLYCLCLVGGLVLMYTDKGSYTKMYYFATSLAASMKLMAWVNLAYGALMAYLLFSDLYNSRMCNGLHALPLRRQDLFVTNVVTGLVYSLVPTALMTLLSLPLLSATAVKNAGFLALYWFAVANLQFICFFGMAIFSALCAGNLLGMAVVYGLLQGGAILCYCLVDVLYTPLLSGVHTPDYLARILTPMYQYSQQYIRFPDFSYLLLLFQDREEEITTSFAPVASVWHWTVALAVVGVVFCLAGWLLYRKRDLERAGDPVSVPALNPVMQVVVSLIGGAAVAAVFASIGEPTSLLNYVVLAVAIVVAWFAVKMVLCRSSRIFEKKAILGLLPVLAVVALSLIATYFDILNISGWVPKAENVRSVTIRVDGSSRICTDPEDIENVLRIHALALEQAIPDDGVYDRASVEQGDPQKITAEEWSYDDLFLTDQLVMSAGVYLEYDLGYGRTASRSLLAWPLGESGERIRALHCDWDTYFDQAQHFYYGDAYQLNMADITDLEVGGIRARDVPEVTPELLDSLLQALQADCTEGNLVSVSSLHRGMFWSKAVDEEDEDSYYESINLVLRIRPESRSYGGIYFTIYADSTHTIQWLRDHNLMAYEIVWEK